MRFRPDFAEGAIDFYLVTVFNIHSEGFDVANISLLARRNLGLGGAPGEEDGSYRFARALVCAPYLVDPQLGQEKGKTRDHYTAPIGMFNKVVRGVK